MEPSDGEAGGTASAAGPSAHDEVDPGLTVADRFGADLDERDLPSALDVGRFEPGRLLDRNVLSIAAGIAVALLVALWPARTDRVLARVVGAAVMAVFASVLWAEWRATPNRPRRWSQLGLAAIAVVLGAVLLVWPDQSIALIARVGALLLALEACRDLVMQLRRPSEQRTWAWPLAKALAGLAAASLVATYPNELLGLATGLLALGWAAVGVVALSRSISADAPRHTTYRESGHVVLEWLDSRPKTADDRTALYSKVLFEGPDVRPRLVRFVTLMTFASVIASMGVITDSTAVVIGAMLVAPLMTPLMGTAISVVMGWPNRLVRSASVALIGVGIAILIGVVLGLIAPASIDVGGNGQIIARASPTILDLITAVAAGAAGAYGLSRPDVSDALPGVAIAISLVPPLSVVGIAYSQGAWSQGNGALLLFVTNALAIVIVGGITFVFTGVTPIRRVAGNQQRVRTASASLVALGALVVGALAINGGEIAANAFRLETVDRTVLEWTDELPGYSFVEARIDGDRVTAVILGSPIDPPTAEDLHGLLVDRLQTDEIIVDVRLLVQQRDTFPVGALDDLPD